MNKIYLLIDLILIKIKQIKRMEINDLRVEKFNKIVHIDQVDNYSIFNSICLSQNYDYAKGFISFRGIFISIKGPINITITTKYI